MEGDFTTLKNISIGGEVKTIKLWITVLTYSNMFYATPFYNETFECFARGASKDLRLSEYFKKLRRYELICIDEFGFIPFNRNESDLLFQFISDRFEPKLNDNFKTDS